MKTLFAGICVLVGAFTVAPASAATPPLSGAAISQELRTLTTAHAAARVGGETVWNNEVDDVYRAAGYAPLWQASPDNDRRADLLRAALDDAGAHGVATDDLHLRLLDEMRAPSTPAEAAARDVLLTDAFLRYAAKLRQGALSTDALGPDWGIGQESFDPRAALVDAWRNGTFAELLGSLAPPHAQYSRLIDALRRYKEIAARGGWQLIPGREEVTLDDRDPRLAVLRQRLSAEGYLGAGGSSSGGDLAAVRLFQTRHGLDPDGRVGPRTLAELNMSPEQRVAQIAANLERWRHVPRRFGDEFVTVNAADATLDFVRDGTTALHMRVVVGDPGHPTPVLAAHISAITFNPPWNIPISIATKEMLPRLKRDPHYLAANDIMVMNRPDDPFGLRVNWPRFTRANFPFQLQQRPGPRNSLGLIKLEMPNRFDVYLHDTPVKATFSRARRAVSHGCIRLEHAGEIAQRLLDDDATWNGATIQEAIAAGETRHVALARPVPIYVLYWTAFVDDDGAVNFREDLYGRDAGLARALSMGHQTSPAAARAMARIGCPGQRLAGTAG